jgi:hypothetical protein
VSYFEVLVVRSKGQVTVGLADAHPASEAPSTSLVNRSRANWMNQPHAVQMLFFKKSIRYQTFTSQVHWGTDFTECLFITNVLGTFIGMSDTDV